MAIKLGGSLIESNQKFEYQRIKQIFIQIERLITNNQHKVVLVHGSGKSLKRN